MGNVQKTLSIISVVIGVAISIYVAISFKLVFTDMNSGMIRALKTDGGYYREDEDVPPTLNTVTVSAPKNGSEARVFEIEHVDGAAEVVEGAAVVEEVTEFGSETAAEDAVKAAGAEAELTLPEDATFGEKISFYMDKLSLMLFGEKEDKIEMKCTSKGEGKTCTVVRG